MKIKKACLFIVSLLVIVQVAFAQDEADQNDYMSHEQKNEIGGAIGISFDLKEQATASGLQLQYYRMFPGKLKHFGVSPGVDFVFGAHKHYAFRLMLIFRPTHGWWINAGAGILYLDQKNDVMASGHVESGYNFDAGKVHFGPMLEYSWAKEDQHIMLGLHLGVPF